MKNGSPACLWISSCKGPGRPWAKQVMAEGCKHTLVHAAARNGIWRDVEKTWLCATCLARERPARSLSACANLPTPPGFPADAPGVGSTCLKANGRRSVRSVETDTINTIPAQARQVEAKPVTKETTAHKASGAARQTAAKQKKPEKVRSLPGLANARMATPELRLHHPRQGPQARPKTEWIPDLTEERIEPHPGPSSSRQKTRTPK